MKQAYANPRAWKSVLCDKGAECLEYLGFAKAWRQLQVAHASPSMGLFENQGPGLCIFLVTLPLLASLHPVCTLYQDGSALLSDIFDTTAMLSAPVSKLLEMS